MPSLGLSKMGVKEAFLLFTCGQRLLEALTASQVHHEQLAYFDLLQGPLLLPRGCAVPLDDGQHDYGMAAAGVRIQPREGKHPVPNTASIWPPQLQVCSLVRTDKALMDGHCHNITL